MLYVYVQQEVTIKPVYVSLDHLIGLLLMNCIMILTLMRLQLVILSNRWLKSSMSDISKLKYAQGISVYFLLSFSLKSTTCIYFVTSKATGACMHIFTSPNTIRIWRNRILFPLCIWCYLIILYKSLWPFCSRNWGILMNIIVNSTRVWFMCSWNLYCETSSIVCHYLLWKMND